MFSTILVNIENGLRAESGMRYKEIGLLCLMLSVVSVVQARDYQQQFVTYGMGDYSCSAYSKAMTAGDERENQVRQWLAGYFSAFNLIIGDNYDIFGSTDFDGMIDWVNNRCKQYPNENLTNVVAKFTEVVYSYRVKVKPDKKK